MGGAHDLEGTGHDAAEEPTSRKSVLGPLNTACSWCTQTAVSPLAPLLSLPLFVGRIEYIATVSGGEALLLEESLIREHQPPFNVLLKDDKRNCETRHCCVHCCGMKSIVFPVGGITQQYRR